MKLTNLLGLILIAVTAVACRQVDGPRHAASPATAQPIYFTCPMHPSVKTAQASNCPICGMKLVPAYTETDSGTAAPCGAACCAAPGATNQP